MNCWFHRWQITHAADARRAVPAATQTHLTTCADCHAFQALCSRLPEELAPAAPLILSPELQQRILERTTRVTDLSMAGGRKFEFSASLFSSPWKAPLAALAAAALLVAVLGGWQHWRTVRQANSLAAVQTVQGLLEKAVAGVDAAALPAVLGQSVVGEYQKMADAAAATVDYFSGILPIALTAPGATADRSG